MKGKKIIIPGGTGYIGQELVKYFGKENEIIILRRQVANHSNNTYGRKLREATNECNVQYVYWNAKTVDLSWAKELDGADMVINLSGKSVNCRYNKKNRDEVLNSRVDATKAIGGAINLCKAPPKLWINAASATIYRNATDYPQDEFTGEISDWKKDNMPYVWMDQLRYYKNKYIFRLVYGKNSDEYKGLDLDFSIQVCKLWENTFFNQEIPYTRKIALRTAITLGKGGIMVPYINLCKFGLGGKHGDGGQMFSWVHIEDVCRMIEWLWEQKEIEGIINCVAPNAISNKELMKILRKATRSSIGIPSPAWLLELGAKLIGTETELMLKSRWVVPTRALNKGFVFKYSSIENAIAEIV